MTRELPTGTYEFRYFYLNDDPAPVAVSNAVSVLAAEPAVALTKPATSPFFTATWKAPGRRYFLDQIGLYKVGAADNAASQIFSTNGATTGTFTTNEFSSGIYELRYFLKDQNRPVAVSLPAQVTVAPPTLTAAQSATNTALVVSWKIPIVDSSFDRIGLYKVGDPDTSSLDQFFPAGKKTGAFSTKELTSGTYEFRYFFKDQSRPVAVTNPIKVVTEMPTLTATQSATSTALVVMWTAPEFPPSGWIDLYKSGDAWPFYQERVSLGGKKFGSFMTKELPPGTYELRYYSQKSQWTAPEVTSKPVTIVANTTKLTVKRSSTSSALTVAWEYRVGSASDWVGLYRVGDSGKSYLERVYLGGKKTGTFTTKELPTGTYEFRYFAGIQTDLPVMVSEKVTVASNLLTLMATRATTGSALTVSWTTPIETPGDWIGLFRVGAPEHLSLQSVSVGKKKTGTFTSTTLSPGAYEFRYFTNRSSSSVAVSKPVNIEESVPCTATLTSGQVLASGQNLKSCNGTYTLTLTADGNLSLSSGWSSNTQGMGVTRLVMQSDGNLVLQTASKKPAWSLLEYQGAKIGKGQYLGLKDDGVLAVYDKTGKVRWSTAMPKKSNTTTTPTPVVPTPTPTPVTVCTTAKLSSGQTLTPGQTLRSCNGAHTATFTTDGNFTFGGWSSNTGGQGGAKLAMQTDGNLVIYTAARKALWSVLSYEGGKMGAGQYLELKDDGTLAVYSTSGSVRWSTAMSLKPLAPTGSISAINPCTPGLGKSATDPANATICDQTISWNTANASDVKTVITGDSPYTTASFPNGYAAGTGISGSGTFWVTTGAYKATLYSGTTKLDEENFTITTPTAQNKALNQMANVLKGLQNLLKNIR